MFDSIRTMIVDYGQAVANRALYGAQSLILDSIDSRVTTLLEVARRKPISAQILMMGKTESGEEFIHGEQVFGIEGNSQDVRVMPQIAIEKGLLIICWGASMTGVYVGQMQQDFMYPTGTPMAKTVTKCNVGNQITVQLKF